MRSPQSPFISAAAHQTKIMAVYQSKLKQQMQFLNFIKEVLTAPLATHVEYCVISGKKLLLYTSTEEWAVQLRHHQAVILTAIVHSSLMTVDTLQVKVIAQTVERQLVRNLKLPSKKNIELMQSNLQTVKDDELKQALLRLSQTLDRLS